jgi:hypothetical protein
MNHLVACQKKDQEKKAAAKGQQFKAQGHKLYRIFDKSVIFTKVQRQDGKAQADFRMVLDRLGKGTLSMSNYHLWQCRSLDALPEEEKNAFYNDGILACELKKKTWRPTTSKKFATSSSPLLSSRLATIPRPREAENQLTLKVATQKILPSAKEQIFSLTSNLWTAMGLTNGAKGVVHSIIYA